MSQSVTLNPSLSKLMPIFRERCACIRSVTLTFDSDQAMDLVQHLRAKVLVPLPKPTKAEVEEEIYLIGALSVTIDLVAQGGRIVATAPEVVINFEKALSPESEKDRIRQVHLLDREDQLRQPATRKFIDGMETKRLTKNGWHSIYSVMRDGASLSLGLAAMSVVGDPVQRKAQFDKIIKPYIQFAEPNVHCEHTGLRLQDIWRYFRHTWASSYKSVPGRSIMILVRDAAGENHPVIGIACLASSVVQQSARDRWIGWDAEGAIERFVTSVKHKRDAKWLLGEVDRFIRSIYMKDLLEAAVITRADLRKPTAAAIQKLLKDSERAIRRHRLYPNASQHKHVVSGTAAEWKARAETSLFRSKRSKQLALLLSVRMVFQEHAIGETMSKAEWTLSLQNAKVRHAITQVIRMAKAERVGVNMMDITVCGAVAPYNLLLGGKLVCLLLCSPEVVNFYERRYGKQTSLIASSMRGAPVNRRPSLALLCTTSLYGSSLSQYSRVKVPAETLGGRVGEKLEYRPIGLSEGFGSFHISQETQVLLTTLIGRTKDARKVNSIFGEGVNPLMRKLREGLNLLGLPSDVLMNHGSKRVVYGVALARNFREVLNGFSDSASYCVPQTHALKRSEMLADYWAHRWMTNRLAKPGLLDAIALHTISYPVRHGARVLRAGTASSLKDDN